MYPYHNRIKQRIRAGELIGYEFREDHPGIGGGLFVHIGMWIMWIF